MIRTRNGGGWCWIFLLVLGLILAPASVGAQATPEATAGPPAFFLEPVDQEQPYISVSMEEGTRQEVAVTLGVDAGTAVLARTFAADAYTLINGGFGVEADGESVSGTTTWLDYTAQSLELQPNQMIERRFTITVPEDTQPGEYITGLVVQTADPIAVGDSAMLRQTIRKAIAVLITVPGPVTPELAIGEVTLTQTASSNSLLIDIEHIRNVLLKPSGTVTVAAPDGTAIVTAPVEMGSVYAGMATMLELPIPTVLDAGTYSVSVLLTDAATGAGAEVTDVALEVTASADVATSAAAPVTIEGITLEPVNDATSGSLQLINITVNLQNSGAPMPGARLTLHVTRDGELVEDYPLSPSLALPTGATSIQQRYIPAGSWEPGIYEFAVTLEAVDLNTGQTTVLMTIEAPTSVTVP